MDWRNELKELVGASDEGQVADLNDMERREILDERSLLCLISTHRGNADVTDDDHDV